MAEKPPTRITLRFCPECGLTDRFKSLGMPPRKHYALGKQCPGKVVNVEYMPVKEVFEYMPEEVE